MRVLNSDLTAEFQKEALRFFYMVELICASTYRFNTTEEIIYSGSDAFSPRNFEFSDMSFATGMIVTQLDLTIDDTDQLISALLLGEDVRNTTAKLYIGAVTQQNHAGIVWASGAAWESGVVWEPAYTINGIVTQEFMRGIIAGWTLSEDNKAKITIKNETVLWAKKTLRTCQSSCPWTFKGTECTYAGAETWCDQSYDRCSDLANTNQFGGFRFLPSIMEKEIWWGRSPGYK